MDSYGIMARYGKTVGMNMDKNGTFWAPNMNHHDMFLPPVNAMAPAKFPDEHKATQSRDPVYQCTCGAAWLVLHLPGFAWLLGSQTCGQNGHVGI